jgi:hypothetical protein
MIIQPSKIILITLLKHLKQTQYQTIITHFHSRISYEQQVLLLLLNDSLNLWALFLFYLDS